MHFWEKRLEHNASVPREHASTTQYWSGSDTEELFNKHATNGMVNGYTKESITYCLNEYGYRSKSFSNLSEDKDKFRILVAGCSHTFGVGLPLEETWPVKFANKFPNSVLYNLGAGGQSPDYVSRIVHNTIEIFKPHLVAIFWPEKARFEYARNETFLECYHPINKSYPYWFLPESVQRYNHIKNLAFVESLCKASNVCYLNLRNDHEVVDELIFNSGNKHARDGHYGPGVHSGIAEHLYQQYLQLPNKPV